MSLVADSPVNSSSSDDFAAILDAELSSLSDTSPEFEGEEEEEEQEKEEGEEQAKEENEAQEKEEKEEEQEKEVKEEEQEKEEDGDDALYQPSERTKKRKTEASAEYVSCEHPGHLGGLCIKCGQKINLESGVAFGYIHQDLRLANDEIARLRDRDLKKLLRHKKLYLVLDLDHTLLNSTRFMDITSDEEYLMMQNDPLQDALRGSFFRLDYMHMLTKLRPFVKTFLEEASKLFEMYIYTMGERAYALEMSKLLDPKKVYFDSKVIAQGDCTQRHQKGLDVVLGQESAVLILDDTESVWSKHKENLILMERYHFFASSCKQFGFNCKSLSELKSDESMVDGALANILEVLKRIHSLFFNPDAGENIADRDVRKVLGTVRKEVLKGCKVVFSRVFPTKYQAENHQLWKMAEQLGATCSTETDESVTHVISMDIGTDKSRWAVQHHKFLVNPRWLEAANYLWRRQPEENFPVKDTKNQ